MSMTPEECQDHQWREQQEAERLADRTVFRVEPSERLEAGRAAEMSAFSVDAPGDDKEQDRPARMQEAIDQGQPEQRDTQNWEARAGRLSALRLAFLAAVRNGKDQVPRPEERASGGDNDQDRPAGIREAIDQEQLEQRDTQEREARASRLAALAATEPAAPLQPAGRPPSGDDGTPDGDGAPYRGDPPCLGGPSELRVAGTPEEGGPATGSACGSSDDA